MLLDNSQMVIAAPPVTEILRSFPSVKNPIHCPSGEKNGLCAPSVPGSRARVSWSSFRT